ncbi:hypothetical protein B0J12DRAFT_669997 [Macrophomina phaseolina]|uniref:Uncharacterized protein n=1 Tax=Macrophomina phaseolina TaxID=35725 RepID=A0ABQ8G597_9PEZI|nr:hypothetical protein B0J12DRAFT_669997 [Macrophomina phaseolina]
MRGLLRYPTLIDLISDQILLLLPVSLAACLCKSPETCPKCKFLASCDFLAPLSLACSCFSHSDFGATAFVIVILCGCSLSLTQPAFFLFHEKSSVTRNPPSHEILRSRTSSTNLPAGCCLNPRNGRYTRQSPKTFTRGTPPNGLRSNSKGAGHIRHQSHGQLKISAIV